MSVPSSVRLSHTGVVAKRLDGSSWLVRIMTTLRQHDVALVVCLSVHQTRVRVGPETEIERRITSLKIGNGK